MASRKKQDEKNLKTLRELAALSSNKYCFDCNQRGPTYVDVTIGSFVCTKCSGLLRGLTPPHRVKSISMATFTQDEIGLLESKGNDYCRKVWLGLFEGTPPSDSRDEQAVKDFMIEKYERKRYYLDPSHLPKNGHTKTTTTSKTNGADKIEQPPKNNRMSEPKPILNNKYNSSNFQTSNRRRPEVSSNFGQPQVVRHQTSKGVSNGGDFVANFDTADIFSASNNNSTTNGSGSTGQQGFANFENNPVFSNVTTNNAEKNEFSIFDLDFTSVGPVLNQVPLFPKCLPTTSILNQMNQHSQNTSNNVPSEDRYAALKDLDNALKSQTTLDWSSSGSNGSLYSSPTPTGSMYSSPSPQSSLFGSPSQGQFLNGFAALQETNGVSNPFGNNGFSWNTPKVNGMNGGLNGTNGFHSQNNYQNPFRVSEMNKMNGFSQMVQPNGFQMGGDMLWNANPFKVGATTMSSNNPFL
ncbi:arf-GAP domain and FG repeat-containing protein 1 isoform X2 [Coccinella septempunctata]|uniref:arf-GAP domain and FG repeat-containing protein 1 isoform X2 n=1 Tax=Coccinella septempunctata TaxID=41139 RepID=UPI001D06CEF0|nr:arf-GAP domain and FG repeat-containing protein 1 isoform X2 [Coccinella septempunctata]